MPPSPAEQPDVGRADIRRPLDESVPVAGVEEPAQRPAPAAGEQPTLRPAVPAEPGAGGPEQTQPATPGPKPAVPAAEPETQEPDTAVLPGIAEPAEETSAAAPGVPGEDLEATPTRHRRSVALAQAARRLGGRSVRLVRTVGLWSRQPGGRYALNAALLATLLAGAVAMGAFVVPTAGVRDPVEPTAPATTAVSPPPSGPPVVAPPVGSPGTPGGTPGATSPPLGQGGPSQALAGWAAQLAPLTAVPDVALRAYGYAELAIAATTPGCQLSWTTLAAIGRVESNHGSTGGATLLPDGRVLPPVLGPQLTGQGGTVEILDTDQAALDGDPVYDRAVGPMQFLPSTWQIEQVDATGDGVADVNNIHDAALAAANYLCRGARNLATAADWWQAVLSYNDVQAYANDVFRFANEYGLQSRGG